MRPANLTRPRRSPSAGRGKLVVALGDRRDALLRGLDDAARPRRARPDARLDVAAGCLDELLGARGGGRAAARARGGCAPCVTSRSTLRCGRSCRGARTSRSSSRASWRRSRMSLDEGDRAVTRLERGADADERGALGDAAAVARRCVFAARTLGLGGLARLVGGDRAGARAVDFDGATSLGGRGARRRALASGRRLARRGRLAVARLRAWRSRAWRRRSWRCVVVVVVVVSAMWWINPSGAVQCIEVRTN